MATDPEIIAHKHWIGYVQPVGLVVSIPALLGAQAYVNRNVVPDHQRFLASVDLDAQPATIKDFPSFVRDVLDWEPADLVSDVPASLEVPLPEYGEVLRPTYAVKEFKPEEGKSPWLMLVKELPAGQPFDEIVTTDERHWQASPHSRFERLLRETQLPIGLLVNGTHLRLVYAPRGENSGYATFRVADMVQVSGRPIFAALHMLLSEPRLFSLTEKQRLPAILEASRKYQSQVSTELAEQVLAALYELLRGFQGANEARQGELLADVLKHDPSHVYNGLLTVLMRLVFVLYAEDRGLLSSDPLYSNYYSVTGLFERLRADAGRYPDTMDQRYGAWSQLLTLFRLIYDGAESSSLKLPPRQGYLFDPDRYNFLEGRPWQQRRREGEKLAVPRVSDGVVFRVLNNLLILDGERLSYRTLDVEQIGSVYEVMMGFGLGVATGPTIAIKPKKRLGAPVPIDLEELLRVPGSERAKWLKAKTDQEVSGAAVAKLKEADSVEALLAALERRVAQDVTPNPISQGGMVPIPSDERRRSGSNYTPRSLTEPIVRKTLEPIRKRLGEHPTPQQLLDLKVCDPAMGSGAFLVEVCRQLGDELVRAWHKHKQLPKIPPDEDEILHARRLIAQRCLYGVDRNAMAVDLAKLSLWLATLAKDHPFTFLDHTLRHGDSLVGLTRQQIEDFTWQQTKGKTKGTLSVQIANRIDDATRYRRRILDAGDALPTNVMLAELSQADGALSPVRFFGNLVIAAFFGADKDKVRREKLAGLLARLTNYLSKLDVHARPQEADLLHKCKHPLYPFHWEIEFPEVFARENGGFDAIVGNPPFLGGKRISTTSGDAYRDWLAQVHLGGTSNADLVAHFYRRSFSLLRSTGASGLIATNTISQGDTRVTGLQWIRLNGGTIYETVRRLRWPGAAAVVVSVVHFYVGSRSELAGLGIPLTLDGRSVEDITAFLFHAGSDQEPSRLRENDALSYHGGIVLGSGFLFDDADDEASPLSVMREILESDGGHAQFIRPYLGGEELNQSPTHAFHRYAIDFGEMELEEAEGFPRLLAILRSKVKPFRDTLKRDVYRNNWWLHGERQPALYNALCDKRRVLANSQVSNHLAFAFQPTDRCYSVTLNLFLFESFAAFAALQARPHELWARFFGSSMKDDLRYTPTDCFDTFPLPPAFDANDAMEDRGQAYYQWRADLMVRNNEGLTKTYNRFHDPDERSADILKLRELHAAMDRAVLDAYGWTDIPTECRFLLDYEEDEDDDAEDQPSPTRRRRKPWRYRWPDEIRDEVLARLLALNTIRAREEQARIGIGSKKPKAPRKVKHDRDGKLFAGG